MGHSRLVIWNEAFQNVCSGGQNMASSLRPVFSSERQPAHRPEWDVMNVALGVERVTGNANNLCRVNKELPNRYFT
jgi:hypothetical protein